MDFLNWPPPAQTADICSPVGGRTSVAPVRIVENGDVRVIVEVIFVYGKSWIIRWYIFSKHCNFLEIRDRVFWNERSLMLELEVPLSFRIGSTLSETPYSAIERPVSQQHCAEQSNQKWVKVLEKNGSRWAGIVNSCSYAHHTCNSEYISICYVHHSMEPAGWQRKFLNEKTVISPVMTRVNMNSVLACYLAKVEATYL